MVNSDTPISTKFRLSAFFAFSILVLFSSCTTKSVFLNSDVIPSARGFVKVKQDKNQNYTIQLHLDHLAEATRLNPPKEVYVIWMESDRNSTRNIGQINRGSSTNNLSASFDTSSPYAPTRIFITAESDGTVQYPGEQMVLTTGIIKN